MFQGGKARGYSIRLQLACLLHDASEAYMADVPRPFKEKLTDYVKSEERLISMLYRHFLGSDLTEEEKTLVKTIDDDLLWYDLVYLLMEKPLKERPKLYTKLPYGKMSFSEVENTFLDIYCRLKEKL